MDSQDLSPSDPHRVVDRQFLFLSVFLNATLSMAILLGYSDYFFGCTNQVCIPKVGLEVQSGIGTSNILAL